MKRALWKCVHKMAEVYTESESVVQSIVSVIYLNKENFESESAIVDQDSTLKGIMVDGH